MADIASDLNWLKTHAILVVIVVFLALGGVYGIESIISKHDAENAARWKTITDTQNAQVLSLEAKLSQDEKDRAQENAQQTAILAQLAQSIAQRDKQTAAKIEQDKTLDAQGAAQVLSVQLKSKPGEVTAQGNNVSLNLNTAQQVVVDEDEYAGLKQDYTNLQQELDSQKTINSNIQGSNLDKDALIASMKTAAADADKSCKAQIADVKAQARKSKLKWFVLGWVAGVISGHYI